MLDQIRRDQRKVLTSEKRKIAIPLSKSIEKESQLESSQPMDFEHDKEKQVLVEFRSLFSRGKPSLLHIDTSKEESTPLLVRSLPSDNLLVYPEPLKAPIPFGNRIQADENDTALRLAMGQIPTESLSEEELLTWEKRIAEYVSKQIEGVKQYKKRISQFERKEVFARAHSLGNVVDENGLYFTETEKAQQCAVDFIGKYIQGKKDASEKLLKRLRTAKGFIMVSFLPISYKVDNQAINKCLVAFSGDYECGFEGTSKGYKAKTEYMDFIYKSLAATSDHGACNLDLNGTKTAFGYQFCLPTTAAYSQLLYEMHDSPKDKFQLYTKSCGEDKFSYHLFKLAAMCDELTVHGCVNIAIKSKKGKMPASEITKVKLEIPHESFNFHCIYACGHCKHVKDARFDTIGFAMMEREMVVKGFAKQSELQLSPFDYTAEDFVSKDHDNYRGLSINRRPWQLKRSTQNVFQLYELHQRDYRMLAEKHPDGKQSCADEAGTPKRVGMRNLEKVG